MIPVVFGFGFVQVTIEDFSVEEARKLDVCFVSVSGDFSLEHCEKMAEGEDGCVVIDNSSAFRCVSVALVLIVAPWAAAFVWFLPLHKLLILPERLVWRCVCMHLENVPCMICVSCGLWGDEDMCVHVCVRARAHTHTHTQHEGGLCFVRS